MENLQKILGELEALKINMHDGDFLLTWEKSHDEILATLKTAAALKNLYENNISARVFDSGLAVSQFRDNSTRTRFSFASAANLLGLTVQDLDEGKSQIAHGETVRETSNMISFLTEVVGIRDDMYLGAGNTYMREVAASLEKGHKEGVLHQRPAVVNLQCDVDHPTQSMADLMHLEHYYGSLEKLRGKKIAMTWAYSPSYGKPLSVPQGIICLLSRMGMNVTLAYPEGYSLIQDCIDIAGRNANQSGGSFRVVNSMEEAFEDADIVYPKSWAPFRVMERRTELLRQKNQDALKELEKECLEGNARFKNWECTEEKMRLTKGGKALYMHCLPADITAVSCRAGEVSASVFDRYRVETYKEAGYKPYVIAAMMLLGRFKRPAAVLGELARRGKKRVG
ncbi:MAG: knotted carbamoyltransferase YgeW [Bdellovibrionales bacterium RIFOXYD1_FULL_53_11]|nr:MAG: knotted carbamoyltransferase YgeW [Bdellovibrionales bacterium RIFOXYD1_FULL_53_11]